MNRNIRLVRVEDDVTYQLTPKGEFRHWTLEHADELVASERDAKDGIYKLLWPAIASIFKLDNSGYHVSCESCRYKDVLPDDVGNPCWNCDEHYSEYETEENALF